MREQLIIITNNPLSEKKFQDEYEVIFVDKEMKEVYNIVRDKIHMGHKLLTHPLMSSIKPNETPYRTICVSKEKNKGVDLDSLSIIESSIMTLKKFLNISPLPQYNEKILNDFQLIDYDLIYHALN
ncbi:GrdX family protein [Hathewaya histolytica]|uniref:GrdX protein n=1 Tax=Hathewaya histolytica TaxID=1498 RepID=A0A4U9R1Y8_HATHI|nr:GrdX family protein [Hathewaya histolytica]VTQ85066.1 GrdX protein [Hathewaya histolytica]